VTPRNSISALLLLTLFAVGCAGSQQVTSSDAPPTTEAPPETPAPVVTAPLPPPTVVAEVPASPGPEIDRALRSFLATRVALRAAPPTARQHGEAWLDVLYRLDDACLLQPVAGDLGAFVRARATLEVELEHDRRRRVALPPDLDERLKETLAAVDEGVDALQLIGAPGFLGPAPERTVASVVLRRPLPTMAVTSPFGPRTDPFSGHQRFHAGVDLGAKEGSMVFAAAPGTVVFAGWQGGFGRHVVVDHGGGIRTSYSHLQDLFVHTGQVVDGEDALGSVGNTGRSTGSHLHFAVTNAAGSFLDPLVVLDVPLTPTPVVKAASASASKSMKR
jgi:hypothetical protein